MGWLAQPAANMHPGSYCGAPARPPFAHRHGYSPGQPRGVCALRVPRSVRQLAGECSNQADECSDPQGIEHGTKCRLGTFLGNGAGRDHHKITARRLLPVACSLWGLQLLPNAESVTNTNPARKGRCVYVTPKPLTDLNL